MWNYKKLEELKNILYSSKLGRRIYTEVFYLNEVARTNNLNYDDIFNKVTDIIVSKPISIRIIEQCEELLKEISAKDELKEILFVAHAHIDMNWQWGFDETVAVTLSTFRTTLDMMKQYGFTFGQSQASCYAIVEKYDPEMLKEIKERIKEGRWEVTASSWVETDRNMPLSETHFKQILFTKKYLSKLLDISQESLKLSFEPDTFGHNGYSPEIFSKAGVKWFYHCRGDNDKFIYRWKSSTGAEVLAYREPNWYNSRVLNNDFRDILRLCQNFAKSEGISKYLYVYGIGDHGGGVTRTELEALEEIKTYPLLPKIKNGSYREFYEYLESIKDRLPIIEGELNSVFDGCYTSQARIKRAFKLAEQNLLSSDACNVLSVFNDDVNRNNLLKEGWINVLFSTFHDILPGSCVLSSRAYALGKLQESNSCSESTRTLALRKIAENIDISKWKKELELDFSSELISEGAGVGYGGEIRSTYDVSRSDGKGRLFTIFNVLPYERDIVVEVPIYDWDVDFSDIEACTFNGEECDIQVIDEEFINIWSHKYFRVLLKVKVPSFGYQTIVIKKKDVDKKKCIIDIGPRVQDIVNLDFESKDLYVSFDTKTFELNLIKDKRTGKKLPIKTMGYFNYIKEDPSKGQISWVIGRYSDVQKLTQNNLTFFIKDFRMQYKNEGCISNYFNYTIDFNNSKLSVTPSVENNLIKYSVKLDWNELPIANKYVPLLTYNIALEDGVKVYKDILEVDKPVEEKDIDFSATRCVTVVGKDGQCFVLMSKDRYGFRYYNGVLSLSLIRSSYEPDRYPEHGEYNIEFAIASLDKYSPIEIAKIVKDYNAIPLYVSITGRGKGNLSSCNSFINIDSKDCIISDIYVNDNKNIILFVRNYSNKESKANILLNKNIKNVFNCDALENNIERIDVNNNQFSLSINALEIKVYKIILGGE